MPAGVYSKIAKDAAKSNIDLQSKSSWSWLQQRMKEVSSAQTSSRNFERDSSRLRNKIDIGRLYMFRYDPKLKMQLPYYDTFPLVFPVKPAPGGFYGLNLHYLPPILRAKLMDRLSSSVANKTQMNWTTKLRLDYGTLSSASNLSMYKPCFKHYLTSHVRSKFVYVPPEEWNVTIMLPTQKFKKATAEQVWQDSRGMI